MALIPGQLCKFADLDLHIRVNNQTLFKRSSNETEDGETRIIPANLQQDYLRVRQTNQKQPPSFTAALLFQSQGSDTVAQCAPRAHSQ